MKIDKIIKIGDENYHYTSGYYSQNKWIDNDTVVLARATDEKIGNNDKSRSYKIEIVKASLSGGDVEIICDDVIGSDCVVYGDYIYFTTSEGLNRYDLKSKETVLIYKNEYRRGENGIEKNVPGEPAIMLSPHITNDGKYISLYAAGAKDEEKSVFIRVNTETGKEEKMHEKSFRKPLYVANHWMICPENKDLFFYAHEGETEYVSNRLWLYNNKTGNEWNIAKQRLDQDGNLGECHGHECWAPDGKGMYFVKYMQSLIKPTGICYVDIETGKHEILYSKYKYWHVGVSKDGRYLLSDTVYAPKQSEVIVVDTKTGEEFCADMPLMTAVHPCHPHPQMSPDSGKVMYTALDENKRTCVKVAYIKHEN